MESDDLQLLKLYEEAFFIQKIGNEAVSEALERNKKNNIASVFSMNGSIYYLLPSGKITRKSPFG